MHGLDGYVNVDVVPYTNVDVVADACHLPFQDKSALEIYAGHLLEHLPRPFDFLLECHRVLVRRGTLALVVPSVAHRSLDPNIIIGVMFGFWLDEDGNPNPDTPYGMHRTLWTMELLDHVARRCGFRQFRHIDPQDDPRLTAGADWQVGAEFIKTEIDPFIARANDIHRRILSESK